MRLDLYLVKTNKAISRTQAQDLIHNKFVFLKKNTEVIFLTKPSYEVLPENEAYIFVQDNPLQKYVSRAGLKLEAALNHARLNVVGKIALDVGQSTGGFTDCLLAMGALKVVGIDVGHDQLHHTLKENSRVVFIEGINVKDLAHSVQFNTHVPAEGFTLVVMDVSFISITKVLESIKPFVAKGGEFLFLVKPQFEAGAKALDKNGIIKDKSIYALVEKEVKEKVFSVFGEVKDYFRSELLGKDGNQEFFIYGKNKV